MLNRLVELATANETCGKTDISTKRLRRCRTKVATKYGISEAVFTKVKYRRFRSLLLTPPVG